ncbi:McrC family protein [Streptomonospora litoralis]|uniref:5-methylcytosine-specific restriction enzyme subunit McrC n=1 Tax=Streptomonospora litoralis TaxID=2498135 RepID=A0A4P6Q1L1_9ACTN|nr:restriction endonuclease [Streptomonospora litoralis]QBI54383.1 5-methylcytosine-specific restriction enzyme subunit McrC [Streptomonospora litoralis]
MTRIELTEHAPQTGVVLTAAQAAALAACELVSMKPEPGGTWTLTADKGLVGAVRVGPHDADVELRVAPKLAVQRIMFLIGYAQHGVHWRRHTVEAQERTDLLPAIAAAFARMADRTLARGVLLGYHTVEEALPVVRGRIRSSEQLRRRFGSLLPVEVVYDDFSPDIAENRILLAAAQRLLRLGGLQGATRALLHRVIARLDGVSAPVPGGALPYWRPSRLNTRYQAPLGLAELVLRGGSYELHRPDGVRVEGLMLRMWQIFEDFVSQALSDALASYGGRCETQDTDHYLDRARTLRLRPDLVYYRQGGDGRPAPAGVADAKYKTARTGRTDDDVYQVLAYCTALDLAQGHLIYASGAQPAPRTHRIAGPGAVLVHQHVLDLDRAPADVLGQVADIAAVMASGALQHS